mgnify:CR=1 FL=1
MVERDGPPEGLDEVSKAVLRLAGRGELTVGELVERVSAELGVRGHEVARAIYWLRERGRIALLDPSPPSSFLGYLISTRCVWFWLLALAVLATDALIALSPPPPLLYLRYVLGSAFVLYLPGASLIELLYPKRGDLSQLERLALSLGLSLALVPLVGLLLNYTPWGIRLAPVTASLTALSTALALGAAYRKYVYHRLANLEEGG